MNDGLKDKHRDAILQVLNQHPGIDRAVLFGSRAMGTFTPTSDIDLALYGDLSMHDQARIAEKLDQLSIPYAVDLVRMKTVTSPELLEHIRVHGKEWKSAKNGVEDNWKKLKLGEVCLKIGSGATPRGGKEAYKGGTTALIRSQNVYNDGFHREGLAFIDDSQANALRSVEVRSNDVLLNITGDSVARVCQAPDDVLPARVNQHVAIIRPRACELDAGFLRYSLGAPEMQGHLLALASAGATRNALTKGMIEALEVKAPSLFEQKRIAHILGTLDNKIELNRRMNATLEATARALFQSWFVDFDPIRAKFEGRQPSRFGEPTAALFPDSFDGEIPLGWELTQIGNFAEFQNGYAFKSKDWQSEGIPVVKIGSVRPGIVDLSGCSYIAPSTAEGLDRFRLSPGDILVGMTGYPGEVGVVPLADPTPYLNQRVGRISPMVPDFYSWIHQNLRQPAFKTFAENRAHGSAQANVSGGALMEFPVVFPGEEVIRAFEKICRPLIDRILRNDAESSALARIRDELLPKLLNGDLSDRLSEFITKNQ